MRVHIVDDEPGICVVVVRFLEYAGYEVDCTHMTADTIASRQTSCCSTSHCQIRMACSSALGSKASLLSRQCRTCCWPDMMRQSFEPPHWPSVLPMC
jgi:hypothetical protein